MTSVNLRQNYDFKSRESDVLYSETPDICQMANIIIMVADVQAPNRCHATDNYLVNLLMCINGQTYSLRANKQTMFKSGEEAGNPSVSLMFVFK